MFLFLCIVLSFNFLAELFVVAEIDINLSISNNDWVDPSDPLSQFATYNNRQQNTEGLEQCNCEEIQQELLNDNHNLRAQLDSLQKHRENSVDVLMKLVLRQFLIRLNIDITNTNVSIFKKAQVSLSSDELSVIRRYLMSEKLNEEFGLREHLRAILENFLIETDIRSTNSLLSFMHSILPYILMFNILFILPAAFIVARYSFRSFSRFFSLIFVAAFGFSCYFTYIRKYQEILAQRFERSERFGQKGNPCTPQGLVTEAFDLLLSYTTIKDKSECLKSYEDMLIEPFLLVDPLQVLAEVLSNFFLAPLSIAGIHMNRFFKNFFINIPLHLAILMTLFLFLMPLSMFWIMRRTQYRTIHIRNNSLGEEMVQNDNRRLAVENRRHIRRETN